MKKIKFKILYTGERTDGKDGYFVDFQANKNKYNNYDLLLSGNIEKFKKGKLATNVNYVLYDKNGNVLSENIIDEDKCNNMNEPMDKISALYATDLTINLAKAARGISEITEFGDTHGYIVSPTGKKKGRKIIEKSITYLTLTPTEKNKNLTFSRPITLYDRGIIDNIEALANHNTHITATEVYRQMNGGSNIKVEKDTIADIESRIDYMRRIMVTVDYTQHMNMNGHPGTYKIEGALLKLDKVIFSLNGKTVTGYRYNAPSPLFEYAKAVEQLATIPVIMLETKSIQKNSIRAESIKQYLLFRLYTMEHQGETISLETILKEIGEPEPTPQQLRAIRNIIENFLEYWSYGKLRTDSNPANNEILNISPIRGYCVNTVGKKVTGYSVIPNSKLNIPAKK